MSQFNNREEYEKWKEEKQKQAHYNLKIKQIEKSVEDLNTSGQWNPSIIPPRINKWNWGAFLLTGIWGLSNRIYISLVCFIPFALPFLFFEIFKSGNLLIYKVYLYILSFFSIASIIMMFILGAKGNEWAWKKKKWESIEHFQRVQKRWSYWGIGIALFITSVSIIYNAAANRLPQNTMIKSDLETKADNIYTKEYSNLNDIILISWQDANKHYGKYVTVEGTIVDTYSSGKACFLNFHADYKNYLSAVIFSDDLTKFTSNPEIYYRGKKIRIKGFVKEYQGKPQIVLNNKNQIIVID